MPRRTLDEAESMIARLSRQADTASRNFNRYYNRTRTLEAAIKKHARGECKCKSQGECLTRLVALTPVEPRPTLRSIHNRRMGVR